MLIDEIRAGETDTLEFKRDVPSDKLRLLKTACAFANCNGGRIVVGVDDDRSVIGVDEMSAFRLADQLVDMISNGCEPQVPVFSEIAIMCVTSFSSFRRHFATRFEPEIISGMRS